MFVTALQKLLAFKALALDPTLSIADRRVAAALVDHYNRFDGRCFPSIDCLAEELQIDRRTVIRSVRKLDRLGVVHKKRHQGPHRTNHYEPNWKKFGEILASWHLGRKRKSPKGRATDRSPQQRQSSHSTGDGNATRICSENLSHESVSAGSVTDHDKRFDKGIPSKGQARRALSQSIRSTIQRMSPRTAAEQSALQRWDADLREHDGALYQAIVPVLCEAAIAAITAAEMRRHGGGLRYILDHREELLRPKASDHG